ncbi:hypothetical protein EV356DRAFT_486310 [Viridothelium virens]|uniref:Integral membrane protein S linking to the trans Golgi network-domain-containing protein n=1 Tax=Viridothelium virens TaxID=1048519 RepID=A0A6A6H7L0_VIRVR|nr:hypothetical protein EV356DRAFT_486310 [Viridothelium virens]
MPPRRRRPPRPGALTDLSPSRILAQILILQVAFYICAAVLIIFTALVAGRTVNLDLVLSWRSLRGDITVGWMLGLCWLLNSLICVIFLLLLIARSKLIPDFAITIHFLHLIVTSFYTRALPTNFFWWVLQIASAALMTSLGIWSCQWRELKPISFGGSSSTARQADSEEANGSHDGLGYPRGRGRGKGADGGGNYEMVGMSDSHRGI